jgi:hypothetical protein
MINKRRVNHEKFLTNELQSAIYNRVKKLYITEIDTRIQNLEQQKTDPTLDDMLLFLGLQLDFLIKNKNRMSREARAKICSMNGRKGGAPIGNKNALRTLDK